MRQLGVQCGVTDRSVTVRGAADRSGIAVEHTSGVNRSGTLAHRTVMGHAKIRFDIEVELSGHK